LKIRGTIAVIVVALTIVKDCDATPPNQTSVTEFNAVPVMVMVVPGAPEVGVNEMISGRGTNVNPFSESVPPGVVILTLPEAPLLTVAMIVVALGIVNELADTPPNLTAVTPVKSVPVMVTSIPGPAEAGVKELILGAEKYVNPFAPAIPPGLVIRISPLDPLATTAVIFMLFTCVKEAAGVPPKLTAVAPCKSVPLIVTTVPLLPEAGVKDVIYGMGMNEKPPLTAIPPGVVTLTLPFAPSLTIAVILVAELTINEAAGTVPKLTWVAPVKLVPVIFTD
jgi:hypothetical protein